MTTTSNITPTSNMNSLRVINDIIDDEFNSNFNTDYLYNYESQEHALKAFENDFEDEYNADCDPANLDDIRGLCHFNMVLDICAYVLEKYEEYDMTLELSHFKDDRKLLKAYVYFYMDETHKQQFIQKIEQYDFEAVSDSESEEIVWEGV
tara:strand:+ start:3036 stop:3485 length:450 start_codon:yes stop_codon:yes gene_type:complete